MLEPLGVYFAVDRVCPVLALLTVGIIFAAVRRSERIRPVKKRADG